MKLKVNDLYELQDLIAKYYTRRLESVDEDGEYLSSGELSAINTFLKNNNITADLLDSAPILNLGEAYKSRINLEEAM